MGIDFTDDQKRVINTRNKNVLVSAAAGSGKTAVLVERIVALVCNPANNIDIDRLLVVTFTKAAAAEMRERILNRISDELEKDPGSEHLQKQYALVHRAMITTIDAFCQNLLRNHFHDIGLDPDFRVMDEGERELMRRDVLSELLEEKYAEGSEEFLEATAYFAPTRTDDSEFEESILGLQEYSESFARPEEYLNQRKNDHRDICKKLSGVKCVNGAYTGDPTGVFLFKYLKGIVSDVSAEYDALAGICSLPGGPSPYREGLEKEKALIEKVMSSGSLEEFERGLKEYNDGKVTRMPACKGDEYDEELKKAVSKGRASIKAILTEITDYFFEPSMESLALKAEKCAPYIDILVDITMEFRRRFQERKSGEHVVDFGDLEHFALEILVDDAGNPTGTALEYREHFREIMVDEYQDSNLVQDIILGTIASKDMASYDRFMVGDVKQSIYGFRQARPDLFIDKFESYPETEGCERIDLSKNFRSRDEVLRSVNQIFERTMTSQMGGIEYDAASRLYYGADYPEGEEGEFKTELLLFDSNLGDEIGETPSGDTVPDEMSFGDKSPDNDDTDETEEGGYSGEETEALVIAAKIKELLKTRVTESVKTPEGNTIRRFRPVRYSDIVILHRSPSKIAETIGRIFEQEGIPISISQGGGYFSVPEVQGVLQLLRTINNPRSEIALYGTLTSVFGGVTVEEVAEMRALHTKENLWDVVKQSLPEFAAKIEHYRRLSTYRPIRELLQTIFDDHDYIEYVTALPAGAKRRANVEMLLSYASAYEKTSYFGLFHFIRYIDQLGKYTKDKTAEADVLGENADVVRLMSIHKSKGLEFPITILAGLGKKFNLTDSSARLICCGDLGIGYIDVDLKMRTRSRTIRHDLLAKKLLQDAISEELRLLYVAMTRAKEKLILTGKCAKAEETLDKAMAKGDGRLSYLRFMKARSYLDIILPVLGGCDEIDSKVLKAEDIKGLKLGEQLVMAARRDELGRADEKADPEKLSALEKRLAYEYPYKYLEKLYTKTTVSELKMAAMLDEDEAAYEQFEGREKEIYIPEFRRAEKKISGTVRGNSYHRVMEIFDFDRTLGKAFGGRPESFEEYRDKMLSISERTVREFLAEELRENRITEECFEAVNPGKIAEFLKTGLAFRMWKSNSEGGLKREQPFVLGLPASKVNKDFPESETVLIQGIIDAYFVEDGKIVLLDYKTDSLEKDEEFVSRYHTQLDYYREAIEKLTKLKVSERLLYSFHLGRVINC